MFSYRVHLAGNASHGEDIVSDKENKPACVLFLKHMQSIGLSAEN